MSVILNASGAIFIECQLNEWVVHIFVCRGNYMGEIEPVVTNRTSKHFGFSLFYQFIVIGVPFFSMLCCMLALGIKNLYWQSINVVRVSSGVQLFVGI